MLKTLTGLSTIMLGELIETEEVVGHTINLVLTASTSFEWSKEPIKDYKPC